MSVFTNREFLQYAGPIALSSMGSVVVGLTSTLIIGHYSTDALAGVALGASVYELPVNALLGALMGYRILAPRLAGVDPGARETTGLSVVLRGIGKWLALGFLLLLTAGILMLFLGHHEPWMRAAGLYVLGRAFSLIPEVCTTAMVVTLVSWGKVNTPLVVFLVTSGVNLAFGYLLVYGIGPFPRLGPLGAGIAASLGALAALPGLLSTIRREAKNASSRLSGSEVTEHFNDWQKLTLPAVGSAALDYAGNIVFTFVIALGGAAGLAGARVANNLHLLAFVLASSLSSAALFLMGRHAVDLFENVTERESLRRRFLGVGALILIFVVAAMCPLISWAYCNVTLLRAMKKTGSDFISNSIAVWGAQNPVALVGALTLHAPGAFAGLAAYWLCRALISQRQVVLAVRGPSPNCQGA